MWPEDLHKMFNLIVSCNLGLGSLSRKGFSLETINKVIDINDIDNANLILEE